MWKLLLLEGIKSKRAKYGHQAAREVFLYAATYVDRPIIIG